jgi:hypothetical protein
MPFRSLKRKQMIMQAAAQIKRTHVSNRVLSMGRPLKSEYLCFIIHRKRQGDRGEHADEETGAPLSLRLRDRARNLWASRDSRGRGEGTVDFLVTRRRREPGRGLLRRAKTSSHHVRAAAHQSPRRWRERIRRACAGRGAGGLKPMVAPRVILVGI